MEGCTTPGNWWEIYYADIAIVQANGTLMPLFNGQTSISLTKSGSPGITTAVSDIVHSNAEWEELNPTRSTYYYHDSALGSSQMMTSGYGSWPVWQTTYLPFGRQYDPQTTPDNLKFAGLDSDPEAGGNLDHAWARHYFINGGRWLTPDPAGLAAVDPANPQSWNRYAYVANNPVNASDPSGLMIVPLDDREGGGGGYAIVGSGSWNCMADGVNVLCDIAYALLSSGAGVACPHNACTGVGADGRLAQYACSGESCGYQTFGPGDPKKEAIKAAANGLGFKSYPKNAADWTPTTLTLVITSSGPHTIMMTDGVATNASECDPARPGCDYSSSRGPLLLGGTDSVIAGTLTQDFMLRGAQGYFVFDVNIRMQISWRDRYNTPQKALELFEVRTEPVKVCLGLGTCK